jgi:ATP-binding cassette subfamily G (WHITE) protein 2 (PDR)
MQPPGGMTCGDYLQSYASAAGGRIYNPAATANCQYCSASNADQFLSSVAISYSTRWRDYGIGFAYIVLYYLIRVRKGSGKSMAERFSPLLAFFKNDPSKENKGDEKKKAPHAKGESVLP